MNDKEILNKENMMLIDENKKLRSENAELKARWEMLKEFLDKCDDKETEVGGAAAAIKMIMKELESGGEFGNPTIKSSLAYSGETTHEDITSKQKSVVKRYRHDKPNKSDASEIQTPKPKVGKA